jgi:putative selenate reductase
MKETYTPCRIFAGTMHYRELNLAIRKRVQEGITRFLLEKVTGQRYIGAGLGPGILLEIRGVPGQDLGVFCGGAKIVVYGNAQDGVGNTMNGGFIIIHGSVGDIPGHMVRNGKIYVKGSAGYRAGIMMKEYGKKRPVMIIGERIGDYVGEYMAGGTIVILGYSVSSGSSPVSRHVASGMFGGRMYVRGKIDTFQLGDGAIMEKATQEDLAEIVSNLTEYCEIFGFDMEKILAAPFTVIRRAGQRPYGNLYVPSAAISRELKPVHRNLIPPCAHACPAEIPNPIIIRKLREGQIQEAFDLVDEYTPFRYSCCGLVCPGLCRAACTRNSLGSPVKINEIASQYSPSGEVKVLGDKKKECIAVIGAGPAGLSASWYLARRGYPVDVYDKEEDIGGKLTHQIPEERLPRKDVDRDLRRIRSLGIRFFLNKMVDAELFEKLRKNSSAVIIAVGVQKPRTIGFTGEQLALPAYQFLSSVKTGFRGWDVKGKSVLILGAGNVAMDVACESFRLGASSVTAVDIQKPAAFGKELDRALELGIRLLYPRIVESFENGVLTFKNGESLQADILIEAIGEIPELEFVGEKLIFEKDSFTTNLPGVYIVGDVVAPGLITHSIGMGRKVAEYVDSIFQGIPYVTGRKEVVEKRSIHTVYFQEKDAFSSPLDECFSCGNCLQCDICVENCPRGAIARHGEIFIIDSEVCSGCGVCASVCPRGAIVMEPL